MALIGIDASRANARERTGTEWYSYYLIQALKKIRVPGLEYALYSKKFLQDGLEEFPPGWSGKILYWRSQRFWNQFRLSWELWRHPVDLFFQPTHTLPLFAPKRSVTTLHDIGFERLPKLYRPAEVDVLIGDPRKAHKELGWQAKISLPELAEMMMEADMERVNGQITEYSKQAA